MKRVRVGGEEEEEAGGRKGGQGETGTGDRRQAKTGGRNKGRN